MNIQQTEQKNMLLVANIGVRATKGEKDLLPLIEFLMDKPEPKNEYELRKLLVSFIENHKMAGSLLVNGNLVWDVGKLLVHFQRLLNNAEYVNGEWRLKLSSFSNYLYDFLTLNCGSIAHYNKAGWLHTYPTKTALRSFFERNEYGRPVANYSPDWYYDARMAQASMAKMILG
jgi:hypothetical protein